MIFIGMLIVIALLIIAKTLTKLNNNLVKFMEWYAEREKEHEKL